MPVSIDPLQTTETRGDPEDVDGDVAVGLLEDAVDARGSRATMARARLPSQDPTNALTYPRKPDGGRMGRAPHSTDRRPGPRAGRSAQTGEVRTEEHSPSCVCD